MLTTESITPAHTAASAAATSTLHVDSSVTMFRFASSSYNSDNSIRVTLQCSTNSVSGAAIRHPTRQLKLPSNGSVIPIGRASKSSAKDLQPTPHNAFFDCAVMSRNHAELYLKGRDVMLRDTESLHGTSVNDKRVDKEMTLHPGDLIKFGDAVTRLQSVHEGIQVRVDITRSEQMLSQPTQTSTMRTNVFKVPSDVSDDDDANKETLDDYDQDEADDLHKLLDEDEPVIVSAARKFPFSKFHILDATHSSGISQHNPVVIDDEDSLDMPQAQAGSAAHEMADSVDSEFAEFDTDDSEIEYGDDEDHVSIKSGPASPRHGRSFQRRAEAYLTDEDSDEDFTPNQPTEVEASVPETEPATGPPQLDVVSPKLFPADRTLPNPEAFKTGSIPAAVQSTDQGNVLPPIGHLSSFSPGNPSMTTQMAWDYQPEQMAPDLRSYSPFSYMYNNSRQYQSSYPGALSNSASYSGYGQRFPATMPNKAMPDYSQDFTNAMPKSTTQQQSMFEAAEVAEPVFDKVDSPVEAEATLTPDNDGESRKRKRADEDVAEAEEADEAEVDDAEAGDEAVIDPTDLTMKRGARVVKLRVRSIDQGSNEVAEVPLSKESDELTPDIVEEQVTEPVEMVPAESVALLASNMGTKADEGRPAKRARTSSVGLALTAAAGAFGGCVATVGFFWSPLAEKLLT